MLKAFANIKTAPVLTVVGFLGAVCLAAEKSAGWATMSLAQQLLTVGECLVTAALGGFATGA